MTTFADIANEADAEIFAALADVATLDGVPVSGMLRSPWLQPQFGSVGTGLVEPQLVIRDIDLGESAQGSAVSIDGRDYTVVSVEPDGTGLTALVLREVVP